MWDDLVSVALTGTQRQKTEISANSSSDSLNKVLSQLNTPDLEQNLLSAAAILAIYQRAGKMPSKSEAKMPEPCELDDLPVCSPKIVKILDSIFKVAFTAGLLTEFLDLLSKKGNRVPYNRLCELLSYGDSYPQFRQGISKVIGKRGQWLAEQNSSWAYARTTKLESVSPQELWQTGSKLARISLLKELRAKDPKKARELVESTWKEEAADYRFASISVFKHNLSLEDEDFLETALDDRAKDIRLEAQKLLSCLSKSKFHSRMLERLRLIVLVKVEKKKTILEINPPEKLDDKAIRDIVEVDPPNKTIGKKAWYLRKIVSSVKPTFWTDELKLPAKEVLTLISKSDWEKDIFFALPITSVNHFDPEWATLLLDWCIEKKTNLEDKTAQELFLQLSTAEKEEFLKTRLLSNKTEKFNFSHLTGRLMYSHNNSWSKDLVKETLDKALYSIHTSKSFDWSLSNLFQHIALYIPESMFEEILPLFEEEKFDPKQWKLAERAIEQFTELLKLRQKMLKEFSL
ncbi:MAG: hypothetical protein HY819_23385 [Acidobacteria bacterium]|nr:hypothetical protein [Acidobacteriota bacterium]